MNNLSYIFLTVLVAQMSDVAWSCSAKIGGVVEEKPEIEPETTTGPTPDCGLDPTVWNKQCCETEGPRQLEDLGRDALVRGEADAYVLAFFYWNPTVSKCRMAAGQILPYTAPVGKKECTALYACDWSLDSNSCKCQDQHLDGRYGRGLTLIRQPHARPGQARRSNWQY